jgi:hypothetical protein
MTQRQMPNVLYVLMAGSFAVFLAARLLGH